MSDKPYTIGPMATDRDAWLEARKGGIGASEAAAACGVSPWSSPAELWARKTGLLPDVEDNDAMRMGRKLEPVVLDEYRERTGYALRYPFPLCLSTRHPFMFATPDAETESGDRLVEAKVTTFRRVHEFGDEGTDDVPPDYLLQCQHQMAVTGHDRVDLAVLVDGRTLRVFHVERHQQLIDRMVAFEAALWRHVEGNTEPALDFTAPGVRDVLAALYPDSTGVIVPVADTVTALWERKDKAAQDEKDAKARKDAATAELLAIIGGGKGVELPDGRVISRSIIADTFVTQDDVDALAAKVGGVKRKGHVRVSIRKGKK